MATDSKKCFLSLDSDFNEVTLACKSVSYAWEELAKYLEINRSTVLSIQRQSRGGIESLNQLITIWLCQPSPTQPKPSWRILCDAMSNIDRPLSEKIWAKHASGCSLCGGVQNQRCTTTTAKELRNHFDKMIKVLIIEIHHVNVNILRFNISDFFKNEEKLNDKIDEHLFTIDKRCKTPEEVLNYLCRPHNFIGYINYSLIHTFKKTAESPILYECIEKYEKDYQYFLKSSLTQIHDAFQQCSDLRPDYPAGMPKFTIHLKSKWDGESMYKLKEFLERCFANRDCIDQLMIVDISRNCFIITFTVLPHIARKIVGYLTNDDVITSMKKEGISVDISEQLMKYKENVLRTTGSISREQSFEILGLKTDPLYSSHGIQQQQADTGSNSSHQPEPESEYSRWLRLQPVIFDIFSVSSQTVVKLTRCAMSKGLVSSTLQELVNDKAKVYTTTERANKLLQYLHTKAKIDVEGKVFQQFTECLKEDEFYKSARENLVKEYEELKSKSTMNPSAQVFQSYADDLGEILAGPNLNTIARKLRSSSVLTEEEYSSVVDPESYHTTECLNTVLRQIGLAIKQDPKNLNIFIEILEREGPFYSSLVESLKGSDPDHSVQTMDDNNPQEITHGAEKPVLRNLSLRGITKVVEDSDGCELKALEAYPIKSLPRGICVIINNEKFQNLKDRAGSFWDANALEELFGRFLGFHIEKFKDLTSSEIKKVMANVRMYDHSQLSCLVVCILSHGVNGEIYGTDGLLVKVELITRMFVGSKCPSLAGKPKLFFFQACRGGDFDHGVIVKQTDSGEAKEIVQEDLVLEEDETDGGGYSIALPDESDFLLAYATTPGYVSWRNPERFGTWFIKAFTNTMRERASEDHLMDILIEVNRKVAEEYHSREHKKQMPLPVSTLRYELYLKPV